MRKCPKCGKTFDRSWKMCLYCDVELETVEKLPPGEETTGWEELPGSKLEIVSFGMFFIVLIPLMLAVMYFAYFYFMRTQAVEHEKREIKESVIFPKAEKKEEKGQQKE